MEVDALIKKVRRELGAEICPMMCYSAKTRAAKLVEGEIQAQYHRLWDYGEIIMKTNPGSLVKIKTELEREIVEQMVEGLVQRIPREKLIFQYMYVRFAPQKLGYFARIRTVVFLDGCHLKTSMGG